MTTNNRSFMDGLAIPQSTLRRGSNVFSPLEHPPCFTVLIQNPARLFLEIADERPRTQMQENVSRAKTPPQFPDGCFLRAAGATVLLRYPPPPGPAYFCLNRHWFRTLAREVRLGLVAMEAEGRGDLASGRSAPMVDRANAKPKWWSCVTSAA
jgi:hypothetical protein